MRTNITSFPVPTRHRTDRTSRTVRLLAGVALGVLPLLAGACGSDGGAAGSSPAASLTADEFRAQGNELCAASNERIGGIIGQAFGAGEPTPAQLQTALDGIVTENRSLIDGLDALAAPPELAAEVDELVADLAAVADDVETQGGPAYFATDDDPWAPAGVKAAALGLTACAGDQEPS